MFVVLHVFLVPIISSHDKLWGLARRVFTLVNWLLWSAYDGLLWYSCVIGYYGIWVIRVSGNFIRSGDTFQCWSGLFLVICTLSTQAQNTFWKEFMSKSSQKVQNCQFWSFLNEKQSFTLWPFFGRLNILLNPITYSAVASCGSWYHY